MNIGDSYLELKKMQEHCIYVLIENITCLREDMNFIFECSTRYRVEHEKIKFISTSAHTIFCLLYKHTNNDVFDDFRKISDHFPKISEDVLSLFRRLDNISRRLPKIAEGGRRFPRRYR